MDQTGIEPAPASDYPPKVAQCLVFRTSHPHSADWGFVTGSQESGGSFSDGRKSERYHHAHTDETRCENFRRPIQPRPDQVAESDDSVGVRHVEYVKLRFNPHTIAQAERPCNAEISTSAGGTRSAS